MAVETVAGATRGNNLVGQAVNQLLKEYYEPGIQDLLNNKTILRRRLKPSAQYIQGGKYVVIDLNTARSTGYAYLGEGGKLPDPKSQTYKQTQYTMRNSYARIKFTGPGASGTRSDRGSFARMMDSEIQGMARDVQCNDNRIMFGDGTGRLAQVSAVSGTTYTLRYPGGIVSTGLGTQYIEIGMTIAAMANASETTVLNEVGAETGYRNPSGTVIGSNITAVDYAAGTITVAIAHAAIAANDYIYLCSNVDSATGQESARGNEPNGLAAIVDDADPTFQSGTTGFWPQGLGAIPSSSNPTWRAGVIDNGGVAVPFAADMFQKAMDLADMNGDGLVSAWYTTHGIRRQYLNTLVSSKRFNDTMEMDGGFKVLTYADRPIFVDKDCTRGRIYGLDEAAIWPAMETDYQWMDQDGNILHRLDNYDAFQATLYCYWQLVTQARNRHVVIQDIQDV